MKNLQNNYTTPQQSKRLLELGVPADSADCYYDTYDIENSNCLRPYFLDERTYTDYFKHLSCIGTNVHCPCWSVGRLIEIFRICGDIECLTWLNARFSEWNIEDLVQAFELYAQEDDILPETVLNFSKLED